jgi:hypothetical protein
VHPLQGQTGGSRRVPDLGCEQDGENSPSNFAIASRVRKLVWGQALSWTRNMYSMFRLQRTPRITCRFCYAARDVLRSRGKEFYNSGIQRLAHCWKNCVESDGKFVEKWRHKCKDIRMIHVNVNVIAITFSKKKKRKALLSHRPSYYLKMNKFMKDYFLKCWINQSRKFLSL